MSDNHGGDFVVKKFFQIGKVIGLFHFLDVGYFSLAHDEEPVPFKTFKKAGQRKPWPVNLFTRDKLLKSFRA
jgi:hypothetical protein